VIRKMAKCKKCGSKVFFVDREATYLEVDGEIVKELGSGGLRNRNCVRCSHPEQYKDYMHFDDFPQGSDGKKL
jgi:DNA-directed RNA polymerase subunit RPC12/RpoP